MLHTTTATTETVPARAGSAQRWVECPHMLGTLPCLNHNAHAGDGKGCMHFSRSGFANDE